MAVANASPAVNLSAAAFVAEGRFAQEIALVTLAVLRRTIRNA
jgi:hypothetical protein